MPQQTLDHIFFSDPRFRVNNAWGFRVQIMNSNSTLANGGTLAFRYVVLHDNGEVERQQTYIKPSSDRANNDFYFPLGAGSLIAAEVGADTGGIQPGECFAQISLLFNVGTAQHIVQIAGGYAYSGNRVSWPYTQGETVPLDQRCLRNQAGTNPAAGVEVSQTVPTGARWQPVSFRATLVTDATVATRRVHLQITDGTNVLVDIPAETTQAASLTRAYTFQDFGIQPSAINNEICVNTKFFLLGPGYVIQTVTDNFQAGDNWGAPRTIANEFLVG